MLSLHGIGQRGLGGKTIPIAAEGRRHLRALSHERLHQFYVLRVHLHGGHTRTCMRAPARPHSRNAPSQAVQTRTQTPACDACDGDVPGVLPYYCPSISRMLPPTQIKRPVTACTCALAIGLCYARALRARKARDRSASQGRTLHRAMAPVARCCNRIKCSPLMGTSSTARAR